MEKALKPTPSLTFQILLNTTLPFTRGKHTQGFWGRDKWSRNEAEATRNSLKKSSENEKSPTDRHRLEEEKHKGDDRSGGSGGSGGSDGDGGATARRKDGGDVTGEI
ncbi:hypothetical protein F2Q69_00004316 [Brassica cretica]|uniref:Uncharacterized protein n=1 Tax=Brassica cretica TaxID=69181 RepID=A0A8S9NP91_BRACR|nr:hypothetical protein F2Q69_00004316 [Brassica cretica]